MAIGRWPTKSFSRATTASTAGGSSPLETQHRFQHAGEEERAEQLGVAEVGEQVGVMRARYAGSTAAAVVKT
ncbi:MAG: hypothetical protein U0736_18710 [Gemmataceae bacterium]